MRDFAASIVESVRHPLLILDGDLRVRRANPAFYRSFGVGVAETEGHLVYELGNGKLDVPGLRPLLKKVIPDDGSFTDFEVRQELPGLGRRVMVLNGRRVHRAEDGAAMILLAIEDVTEREESRLQMERLNHQLEERVRDRTARLVAANQELESFCYSVSHDLRAPLRALDGFSDELIRGYSDQLDDRGRHYLERLRSNTRRMGQLIDDLLQLSRLSRDAMRSETVDLSALAEAVAAELKQREPRRDITFSAESGLSAVGDKSLLRVALENLLANAWKFTSAKPRATVTFGRTGADANGAFFVRDDGAGFDMAHAGKLFGAFQRLHPEREFPGTGIGLATVQRIVRRHGGEIWGEGEPAKGATFYFTLPQGGRS